MKAYFVAHRLGVRALSTTSPQQFSPARSHPEAALAAAANRIARLEASQAKGDADALPAIPRCPLAAKARRLPCSLETE